MTSAFFSKDNFTKAKLITAAALIIFGAMSRYLLKDAPNIETITVVSLLAGSLLGGIWTFVVGLAVVGITDMFIGNTIIFAYTWSAWAVMGLFGFVIHKRAKKPVRHALELTGMGLLGVLFFYAWTNFGVWHVGRMYPHTIDGLIASYIAGIPFLKNQLMSTLMFVPSVSAIGIAAWNRLPKWITVVEQRNATTTPYVREEK
jgi:hypothetical protein